MPSTKELVNYVKMNANGWQRVGEKGILPLLNEAQNILLQQESDQNIVYADNDFPALKTVDSTYEYAINSTNVPDLPDNTVVWRVGAVLLKVPVNDALRIVILGEYGLGPEVQTPVEKYRYNGKEYFRFQQVSSVDRIYDTPASVRMHINPGTTTDDFRLLMFKSPTQIVSERINPTVPERLHFTVLLPAVIRLVEAFQTGAWVTALQEIEKVYKPMMRHELSSGEQGVSYSVQRRRI